MRELRFDAEAEEGSPLTRRAINLFDSPLVLVDKGAGPRARLEDSSARACERRIELVRVSLARLRFLREWVDTLVRQEY